MAVLKATKREGTGTRKARQLRNQGLIPGVIYGHGLESTPVTLSEHDVELAIMHGERLLEVDLDGKKENALIKDVQYDTYGQVVTHLDLARVNLDERVEVTVAIVLKGTPAGVAEEGGVLQQIAAEAKIECPVRAIPESIDVSVSDMGIGQSLTIADLSLPDGSRCLDDPAAPVAVVRVVAEEEAAPAEEEEAPAEPEVIGEKQESDAEGEEAKG